MVEELTPQVLSLALLALLLAAPLLTLVLSSAILVLYRRTVLRTMAATSGGVASASESTLAATPAPIPARLGTAPPAGDLYKGLVQAPWRAAARCGVAGTVFALVMTLAVGVAFPTMRTVPKLAMVLWGALWPVVLALTLKAPGALRTGAAAFAVYAVPLILVVAVAVLLPGSSSTTFGGDVAALRAAFTPPDMVRAWLVLNGVPTVLLLLFLNRWTRAVGPLVLGFITVLVGGLIVAALTLLSRDGSTLVVRIATVTGISVPTLLTAAAVAAVGACGVVGWALLQWIRRGYLKKTLNDRSLTLDAIWLVFATCYALFFALVGLAWVAVGPLAFIVYRLVSLLRPPPRHQGRGLTFLRVFSLGRRSDDLFDAIARHWRHVGSMQLITGPDVAHSTVQPHQLLDFLSGRLHTHFIGDARSLEQRMQQRDTAPDRDGTYRINNFFCYADSWEAVLRWLVAGGDVVLMDLRRFSPRNAGCVVELHHLVNFVPLTRWVLVVDDSTDHVFLRRTLREAWHEQHEESPNRGMSPEAAPLHRLRPGRAGLRELLARLCDAG